MEKLRSQNEEIQFHLTLPERISDKNHQPDLGKKLGEFLVQEDFTLDFENEEEMTLEYWRDYFFRRQITLPDGTTESFFPMHPLYQPGEETNEIDTYMHLKKVISAYREYVLKAEIMEECMSLEDYYKLALLGETESTIFVELFRFCYEKRERGEYRGLSIPGSSEEYDNEKNEEIVNLEAELLTRTLEDMDELITMYLWNPQFFEGFINYLPTKEKGNLRKKLLIIEDEEVKVLKALVFSYVEEMKERIGYNKDI
jgi:hypothetical protein